MLVDDHPIVRRGLAELIAQEPTLSVCGEASTCAEALKCLEETKPDLVILDVSLGESNGIELTRQVRSLCPELAILVLSMHEESVYAERAVRAGANGYVMKAEAAETLLKSIRQVLSGEVHVSEKIGAQMLRGLLTNIAKKPGRSGIESLSNRELEIFDMIGMGMTTREIAARLNLSIKTVETHRSRLKAKLCLRNAAELAQQAANWVTNCGAGSGPGSVCRGPRPRRRTRGGDGCRT